MKSPDHCMCGGKAEVQYHKRFAFVMCTKCEKAGLYFNARTLILRHNGACKMWNHLMAKEREKLEAWGA